MLVRTAIVAMLLGVPLGYFVPTSPGTKCDASCAECGEGNCRGARACKKMRNACGFASAEWSCTKRNAKGDCVRGGCHKCLDE